MSLVGFAGGIDLDLDRLTGLMFFSCVSLKFAVTQMSASSSGITFIISCPVCRF